MIYYNAGPNLTIVEASILIISPVVVLFLSLSFNPHLLMARYQNISLIFISVHIYKFISQCWREEMEKDIYIDTSGDFLNFKPLLKFQF